MKVPQRDRWIDWVVNYSPGCKYNLSLSALPFPNVEEAGIETSLLEFERYGKEAYESFKHNISAFLDVNEECVLPVGSGSQAIFVVSSYLAERYDSFAIPVPEYSPILEVPENLGLRPNKYDLQIDPPTTDLILCSTPNNPVGIMPVWIRSAAEKESGVLFADETFLPFTEDFHTLFKPGRKVICSGTTTKYFGLGDFKTGWLVSEPDIIEKLDRIHSHVAPGMSSYSLWLGSQAIESGEYFRNRSRKVMTENLELVNDFVEGTRGLSWIRPDSAPYGFVRFAYHGSEEICSRILKETGVLLVPGSFMGQDQGFRLCFTSGPDELEKGLNQLRTFFENWKPQVSTPS